MIALMLADQAKSASKSKGSAGSVVAVGRVINVSSLCRLLEVSRAGYYAHLGKPAKARRCQDRVLGDQIEADFELSRGTYGSPRLVACLHDRGLRCGKTRVRRLMDERELQVAQKRRYKPRTTQSGHGLAAAPNVLATMPLTTQLDQQWVSDITYLPTKEGYLYLAGTLDKHSRMVVGWQTSKTLDSEVVLSAARKAFKTRDPVAGLIYHSDQGCQYAGWECRNLLKEHQSLQSMSRRGNCYDNATMESFWATLKTECFGLYIPATRAEARTMVFDYVEGFYNGHRKHSSLGMLSPMQFEQKLRKIA